MGADLTQGTPSLPGTRESAQIAAPTVRTMGRDFDGDAGGDGQPDVDSSRERLERRRAHLSGPHLRLPDERARLRAAGRVAGSRRLPAGRRRHRRRRRRVQHLRGARERRQQAVRQPQPPRAAQAGRPRHADRRRRLPGAEGPRRRAAQGAVGGRRVRHPQHRFAADAARPRPAQQRRPGRNRRGAARSSRPRCPRRANPPTPHGFPSPSAATTPARSASCPRCAARRSTAGPATSWPRCSRWSTRACSR